MRTKWSCTNCGYVLEAEAPPNRCPSCHQECAFTDATCYTPDCGGPESGNIDPRLVNQGDPGIKQ
jgi:rubredoxin